MKPKLGVLVIGPGWVSEEHIKGYLRNPNTEIRAIAGVVEEDRARTARLMSEYGFKCEYFGDYKKALKNNDIQLASVCTINSMHYIQSLHCIRSGKHTLTEKPVAMTVREAFILASESEKHNVKTHAGHVARYYGAIKQIKNILNKGGLGDIFYGECDYWHEITGEWKVKKKTGGSSLLMGGVHAVDMLRFLMGEQREIREVFAYSAASARRRDFDYHPNIVMLLNFKDGGIGKIGSSLECAMPYVFHLQICGTKGSVRNRDVYFEKKKGKSFELKHSIIEEGYPDDWNVAHHPFPEEIDSFVDCVVKDVAPELSFEKAYKTYEVIFAAEESARTGKPVKLPFEKGAPGAPAGCI